MSGCQKILFFFEEKKEMKKNDSRKHTMPTSHESENRKVTNGMFAINVLQINLNLV